MVTAVGDVVAGRYRLRRRVGSGAMGVVWEAVDERLGRPVAVKQLLLPPGLDPDRAGQRVMREGRIAARLHHPHAVAVYDVVMDDGLPMLVMEYLPSRSLADQLAVNGRLEPTDAAGIGVQVASALAAAHAAGIVHRDVKPGNVLIADHTAKISDFGISHASGDVSLTQTGLVAGTPAFLAPEVAQGRPAAQSADVFSLGATLYAAVEGRPPFGEDVDNPLALLRVVAAGAIPAPRHAGPLTPVLAGMLRADPGQRLTAAEAERALRAVANGDPVPAGLRTGDDAWAPNPNAAAGRGPAGTLLDRQPVPIADSPRVRRRRWALAASAVAALVAAVLLFAGLLDGPDTPRPSPPTAAELERAVAQYYGLLPDRAEQAWTRLGPGLRTQGKDNYLAAWNDVNAVKVISPPRATGAKTVHVGVELTRSDGTRIREFHQFGLLVNGDRLLLNADTVLHTERLDPPQPPRDDKDAEKKDEHKDEGNSGKGGDDRKGEEDKTGEDD